MPSLRKSIRDESPESTVFGIDEAIAKISTQLMTPNKNNLYTISDITPEEVFGISLILNLSAKFKSKIINQWVEDFLMLRVSRLRLGRKELMMIGTGMRQESEKKRGAIDLFSGLK